MQFLNLFFTYLSGSLILLRKLCSNAVRAQSASDKGHGRGGFVRNTLESLSDDMGLECSKEGEIELPEWLDVVHIFRSASIFYA